MGATSLDLQNTQNDGPCAKTISRMVRHFGHFGNPSAFYLLRKVISWPGVSAAAIHRISSSPAKEQDQQNPVIISRVDFSQYRIDETQCLDMLKGVADLDT